MDNKLYQEKRKNNNYIHYRLQRRLSTILNELNDIVVSDNNYNFLDIGSFDGYISSEIAKKYQNIKSFAIDNKLSEYLFENVIYTYAEGCRLPFQNEVFDIIIATAVIEHILDTKEFLTEVNRILKKNGYLILTFPNPVLDLINSIIKDTGHVKRFYKKKIFELMNETGFDVKKYSGFMLNPFPKNNSISKVEVLVQKNKINFILSNRIIVCKKV